MSEQDWQAAGERIESLIDASASAGPVARARAEELVRLIADLYGAGLERLLGLLHAHGALTDEVLAAVAGDDLVSALLLVHGLHPDDAATRIERALDGIRPALAAHGAEVELVEVAAEAEARLRLVGGGDGCSASSVKQTIQSAVEAAAPEIASVRIDQPAAGMIPVSSLFSRLGTGAGTP